MRERAAAHGVAIARNVFAECMRCCRGDYRVVPWSQAGNQAVSKAQAPADQSNTSCPHEAH